MRTSGILMHITSLPGPYGVGTMGKNAYAFVDFLEEAGQSYWQILPLTPTGYGDSPYQSFSIFAGNPYFICLEDLVDEGLLTIKECEEVDFGTDKRVVNYERLYQNRFTLLKKAYHRADLSKDNKYAKFTNENAFWLDNYALYMSVKNHFSDRSFDQWDNNIKMRSPEAISYYEEKLADVIGFYKFLQYKFMVQWTNLKKYANSKGIVIIGDIPIYVSYDSSDVWANPELFQLDTDKSLLSVAGCPPDGFSVDGQLWGNPIYDWDYHEKTGFAWWKLRMAKCKELYDVIRIDHFRGFDEYYSIPADSTSAVTGMWKPGPGMKLFHALKETLSGCSIIAEDLGFITDSVRQLVKDTGFPNMKVLEFAFDERDTGNRSEYLPHNYSQNCVVYTGTHDNETLMGWLDSITPYEYKSVKEYVDYQGNDNSDLADRLICLAHSCIADTCIIPFQDYLHLDNEARINQPSTLGGNWVWRMQTEDMNEALAQHIGSLTTLYQRA